MASASSVARGPRVDEDRAEREVRSARTAARRRHAARARSSTRCSRATCSIRAGARRARPARARVPRPHDDELRGSVRQGKAANPVRSGAGRVRARLRVRRRRRDVAARASDFEPQLEAQQSTTLFRDVEVPLVGVLAEMEWAGVAIDIAWFASLKERFERERQRVEQEIYVAAGGEFNINSNPQASRDPVRASSSSRFSRRRRRARPPTRACCKELAEEGHELPVLLMEYRELSKLESTYIDALPRLRESAHGAAAHVVQPDRRGDWAAVVERSESPEHPDPSRARARHSPRLRSADGLDASSRPTIRRSSCDCSRTCRAIRRSSRRSSPAATSIARPRRSSSTCRSSR